MSFLDLVVGQPAWPAAQIPTSILFLDCLPTVLPTQAVVALLCSCSMHLLELVHGCWRSHVHTDRGSQHPLWVVMGILTRVPNDIGSYLKRHYMKCAQH